MSTGRRVARRDRQWLDAPTVGICGPFDMPSLDELTGAVAAVAQRHPHSRFLWRLDETGRRWVRGDHTPPVVERAGDDDLDAYLTDIANDTSLPAPLVFVRSDNYLALKISHAVGDGTYFNRAMSGVLATLQTGTVPDWPVNARTGAFPLAAAVLRTFGRHPARVRKALVDSRSGKASGTSPGGLRQVRRRTHVVTLPADVAEAVIEHGRARHPGVSRFGVQAALVVRGLAEAGIAIDPNVLVLHDLRRYYGSPDLDGNFVVGVPTRFDPAVGPAGFTAAIRATSSSGRPLLTQLATTLSAPSTDSSTAPIVALSSLGAPPAMSALCYRAGATPVYTGSLHPAGLGGITVLLIEVQGTLSISISFNEPVTDLQRVTRAGEIITGDPVGLVAAR